MALAESLKTKLTTAPAATAVIVGAGDAAELHPGMAPSTTSAPYVVWQELPSQPDNTLGEAAASRTAIVQFSCIGATYLAARNLGAAIKADLDNQTLAAGEVVLSVSEDDGFSEATDQFLRIVQATIFVPYA